MEPAGLLPTRRHSHLHIVAILLVIAVFTDNVVQAQRVITEPEQMTLVEGQPAKLLCRLGTPINYCRIAIPGEEKVLVLSDEWDKTPGFKYNGAGLQAGQCGVTIDRINARNHGQVKCSLGVQGEELSGLIDLTVALPPLRPEIEIVSSSSQNGPFGVDKLFSARCVIRDGRPPANITWFLNDEPIYQGLSKLEISEHPNQNGLTLYSTAQVIQRYLTAEDNGKYLICRAAHIADDPNNEAKLQLLVTYPPQPLPDIKVYGLTLGTTAMVTITIHSNPKPQVQWTVGGLAIPQGTQNGRYEASEPVDLGNGAYNVTLIIAGLTLEDTTKEYYLRASNEYGPVDYTVRISSSNTPASQGLDIGAIVGIVVALLVLLIVVLLIIFARATGRWCFAGKTPKSPTSETPEDAQSGANSFLLRKKKAKTFNSDTPSSQRNSVIIMRSGYLIPEEQEERVYNPTTVPLNDQTVVQYTPIPAARSTTANGSNLANGGDGSIGKSNDSDRDSPRDLLKRGNELGIPESRCSKWIPKDQRELLEKQARLLVSGGNKSTETDIY